MRTFKSIWHAVRDDVRKTRVNFARRRDVFANAAAYILLLWTSYGLIYAFPVKYPTGSSTLEGASPQLAVWSAIPAGFLWLYALTVVLALWAFAYIAASRRLVAVMFGMTFVGLHWLSPWIGWDRVALSFLLPLLATFLYEFVRQNKPLAKHLWGAPGLGKEFRIALKVWWPMLAFIALGVVLHFAGERYAKTFVYSASPINEYCDVVGVDAPPIPCEEVARELAAGALPPPVLAHAVALHVDRKLAESRHAWIDVLDLAGDDQLADEASLGSLIAQFGLGDTGNHILGTTTAVEVDPETAAIRAELAAIAPAMADLERQSVVVVERVKILPGWKAFQMLVRTRHNEVATKALAELQAKRAGLVARETARAVELTREQTPDEQVLLNALSAAFQEKLGLDAPSILGAMGPATTLDERKALAIAHVIRRHQQGPLWKDRLMSVLTTLWPEGPARTEVQSKALADYQDAIRYQYCTLEQASQSSLSAVADDPKRQPTLINVGTFACPFGRTNAAGLSLVPRGVRVSATQSINAWRERKVLALDTRLAALIGEIDLARDAGTQKALGALELVPPNVALGRDSCDWWKPNTWIGCAKNKGKEKAEGLYRDGRQKGAQAYLKGLKEADQVGHTEAIEHAVNGRPDAIKAVELTAREAHRSVENYIAIVKALGWLGVIGLVLAVLKSLITATAIVIFDEKGLARAGLRGQVTSVGGTLINPSVHIPASFPGKFLGKRQLENQLAEKPFFPPWPFTSIWGRARRRCYFSQNFARRYASQNNAPMRLRLAGGKHVVGWRMTPGEEVVFQYKYFFGVTDNIQLRSDVSLALETLPLGRVMYCVARFDPRSKEKYGYLLLTTSGQPTTNLALSKVPNQGVVIVPLHRLVAWSRHTAFQLVSERTAWTMWRDGTSVKVPTRAKVIAGQPRKIVGKVIIDADDESAVPGAFRLILKNLRTAMSPI